jgi:hypothetical protein
MTDTHGRPICFIFSDIIDRNDGSDVFVDQPMVRNSINYKQMEAGFGYPLYYNTLPPERITVWFGNGAIQTASFFYKQYLFVLSTDPEGRIWRIYLRSIKLEIA